MNKPNKHETEGRDGQAYLLRRWQERLARAYNAYADALERMEEREALYRGTRTIDRPVGSQSPYAPRDASTVRNIVAEIIEAEISSDIPTPKVTPRRAADEVLATRVETLLRSELDRLPFERLNDLDERTTPTQGGDLFLVEWDERVHTSHTRGALSVTLLHPRQFIPQPGIYHIPDMDYCFLQLPQTRECLQNKYQVQLPANLPPDPHSQSTGEDGLHTECIAYFKNKHGGIGRAAWVGDTLLEYNEDYQCRRLLRCTKCGGIMVEGRCSECGGSKGKQEYLHTYTTNKHGEVPYFTPGVYPIVLRRNVSVFGQLLGASDVDMIRDQQMALNKLTSVIDRKLLTGGSYMLMPRGKQLSRTDEQLKVVELDDPSEKSMIDVLTIQPDISKDLAYIEHSYQAARNLIGITDSFQGRRDETATSGVAKQFAAAQTAGRLESRRRMKNAAYADLFEVMFRFLLAYADEPRPIMRRSADGTSTYDSFCREDFLCRDEAGQYYWNTDFAFSVDQTAPLAGNRESLWTETRTNLEKGCLGDPNELSTLILFWTMMESLHYPLATEVRNSLQERQRTLQQSAPRPQTASGSPPQTARAALQWTGGVLQ